MAGTPIMDHILQAMLLDGEPNTHFMLSWANEPWTATWDGLDSSKVLIAQDYGDITDWRKHFDWLLPFFRHPNYIRSEGKVQFIIYYPAHIDKIAPGAKYAMYAAWRKWAAEEGLVGMVIIPIISPSSHTILICAHHRISSKPATPPTHHSRHQTQSTNSNPTPAA